MYVGCRVPLKKLKPMVACLSCDLGWVSEKFGGESIRYEKKGFDSFEMDFWWWFMVTVHWQSQDFVCGPNYGNNILVKTNLHTHA